MTTRIIATLFVSTILLVGTPLVWLVLSSIFLRGSCPKCGWDQIRSSMPHSVFDRILRVFSIRAFRCRVCRVRFYRFRLKSSIAGRAESKTPTTQPQQPPEVAVDPSTFQTHSQWQRCESTIVSLSRPGGE